MYNKQEVIPENIFIARIEKSEQMREFLIQIWRNNPQLLAQAGEQAQMIMTDASQTLDHLLDGRLKSAPGPKSTVQVPGRHD